MLLSETSADEFALKRFIFIFNGNILYYFKMDYAKNLENIEYDLNKLGYLVSVDSENNRLLTNKFKWDLTEKNDKICLDKIRSGISEVPGIKIWYSYTNDITQNIRDTFYRE